jgi:hypothetical protein
MKFTSKCKPERIRFCYLLRSCYGYMNSDIGDMIMVLLN